MPRLTRLSIAARNPRRVADFYHQVFDLKVVQESQDANVLSDGLFSLCIFTVRPDRSQGLSSMGFLMEDMGGVRERLERSGTGEFLVRDPDVNLVDLSEKGFGVTEEKTPFPIRHIALYTPNPQRLCDFYVGVLGMKEVTRSDRSSIFVSDGYVNLALLFQRSEEKLGLHHFGFHVDSNREIQRRVEGAGLSAGAQRPDRIPYAEYRVHDPEGNGFDISEKGWEV